MYLVYGNDSNIDIIKKQIKKRSGCVFKTLGDVFDFSLSYALCSIDDLDMIFYAYDERIDKNVFMIRQNIPGYKSPQFCRFLVEI